MMIEFSFGNFRSFPEMTTLSMVAANISSKYPEIDENNVFEATPKLKLLKSKAIYGDNAGGKSNVAKAMVAMLKIVRLSVKDEEVLDHIIDPFRLNQKSANEPTFFQMIFLHQGDEDVPTLYRYGFEVKKGEIISEWLFGKPRGGEVYFFTRENMTIRVNPKWFKEAKKFENLASKDDSEIYRKNSLFLTSVAAVGGVFAKSIMETIGRSTVVSGLNDPKIRVFLREELHNEAARAKVLEFLRAADFDIEGIEPGSESDDDPPEDMPERLKQLVLQGDVKFRAVPSFKTYKAVFNQKGERVDSYSDNLDKWESEGTKKMFHLSLFLIQTLKNGDTLLIDEFDARLHPNLTKKIVQLFNSKKTNPKGAQLIFITHDTSLLKPAFLRRDQICFVHKDKFGASTLRTLVEYKGVRNDASFDKDYLSGKFEAIPFLNRLEQIFEN